MTASAAQHSLVGKRCQCNDGVGALSVAQFLQAQLESGQHAMGGQGVLVLVSCMVWVCQGGSQAVALPPAEEATHKYDRCACAELVFVSLWYMTCTIECNLWTW